MEKELIYNYIQGMDVLDDIQTLSNNGLTPLINQASFHLSEVRRKAEKSINNIESFQKVSSFLEDTLDCMIRNFFLDKFPGRQLLYQKTENPIGLKVWNRLLGVLPPVLTVVQVFPFIGTINVQVREDKVIFRGLAKVNGDIQKYRKLIYAMTRKLLAQESLFTFKVEDAGKEGMYWLELSLDVSHDVSKVYRVDLREKHGVLLGFSSIFKNYSLPISEVENLGRHLCIEINDEMKVEKFYRIPDHYLKTFGDRELLHFPFLFRPVSLIIPKRGNVVSANSIREFKDTGSGFSKQEQDVDNRKLSHYRYIDFFSLIK